MNNLLSIKLGRNTLATAVIGLALGSPVLADITDINSVQIIARNWNDYPNSNLVITDNFPSKLEFFEDSFGEGGYANQHLAWFSSDNGASPRKIATSEAFEFSTTAYLDAGSIRPRKEAGFRFVTPTQGDALFIITSDGEVAAFGANFPFYLFGPAGTYEPGTEVQMGVVYRPGNNTIEYQYNGNSSGELKFANDNPDFIDGTYAGLYGQFAPDDENPSDFGNAIYTNTTIAVPEPTSLMLIALAGLCGIRRR